MTKEQKILAILQAIQENDNLFTLLRASVNKNLPNVEEPVLDQLILLLGIPNG